MFIHNVFYGNKCLYLNLHKLSEPSQELKSFQIGRRTTAKHKIVNLETASVFHGIYEYLYAYVCGKFTLGMAMGSQAL